jgi:uncharacterized membrane protein
MNPTAIIATVCGLLFIAYGINKIIGGRCDECTIEGIKYIVMGLPYLTILILNTMGG